MSNCTSCVGCKFLYGAGSGYSNYTWEETWVCCALDKNPNLGTGKAEEPYDWKKSEMEDNWDKTNQGRCDSYKPGPYLTLDVDRECWPCSYSAVNQNPGDPLPFVDQEQLDAIFSHDVGEESYYGKCPRLTDYLAGKVKVEDCAKIISPSQRPEEIKE